jgi:PAS domain S-box-containing protein
MAPEQFSLATAGVGEAVDWESAESFRNLVLTLPAAVYTTDPDGVIKLFNEPAANLWGRRPEVGVELWCGSLRIYHPDGRAMAIDECPMAITLRTGVSVQGQEIVVERPDGTRRWVLPHPELLRNETGKVVGAVNMLVDITARKKAEEQIQELNRSLEARVVERTGQLEAFCYSIAHDLRQHIRGVSLNAHLVGEMLAEADEQTQDSVRQLESAAKRMDRLVTDLLGYARTTRQDVLCEPVDLSLIAQDVADHLSETYPAARFCIQPGLVARGDAALLGVVLQNLLDNACKYAAPERPATVEFGGEAGVFFVRDNGIGFDPVYAGRLFRPFQRLHREAEVPGTGIGLASVKQIVERHGGQVWAETSEADGSTFSFSLPA